MDKREFVKRLRNAKRLVIKIGSGVITSESSIDIGIIENIARNVAEVFKNKQIVIVSSGAVACGLAMLDVKDRPSNIVHLQALASLGQPKLMNIYQKSFEKVGRKVAQVLITIDDIQNRRRFINAKNATITLLKWKIIPIVNENDTVVIKELRFGDNDSLSFHVSNLVEADALIILSDVDGVYTKDPNEHGAVFIEKYSDELSISYGKPSELGRGGIKTKIDACVNAAKAGKLACITNGRKKDALKELIGGKARLTFFEPYLDHTSSKKSWINSCNPSGVVVVDEGAKHSLLLHKSLLPSGIKRVYGGFGRGDIINIEDENGELVAKGITNYDSSEIDKIKGRHSREIIDILGYKYSNDVVHIDNMVIVMGNEDV